MSLRWLAPEPRGKGQKRKRHDGLLCVLSFLCIEGGKRETLGAEFSNCPRSGGKSAAQPGFPTPKLSSSHQLTAGTVRQAGARCHHRYHQHQDAVTEQGLHCALCLDKGSYYAQTPCLSHTPEPSGLGTCFVTSHAKHSTKCCPSQSADTSMLALRETLETVYQAPGGQKAPPVQCEFSS